MKSFASVALFAVSAYAACEEDHHRFPTFSAALEQFEYAWEPYTTTTDDGYILTMFRLAGPIGNYPVHRTASQSVLIMPGMGMSADSWFPSPEFGEPMPIQLYEAGYDVWLGNNRGPPRLPSLRLPSPPPRCAFPRLLPRRTSHRRPCAPHCPGSHSRAPARRERLLAQPHPPRPRRRRGVLGLYL